MSQCASLNSQNRYEIRIYGYADDSWRNWFGQADACSEKLADHTLVTTFSNVVMDQAGLVGLIRRLHGVGIVICSIRLI